MTALGRLRRTFFGIPSEKSVFSRPGFAKEAWERFQPVAHSLVEGYHATLEDSRFEALVPRLDAVEPALRGFAYEGAGMGLAALDCIAPWKNRLQAFVDGPGADHIYPVYVGVGLALARLGRRPERYLARLDPLLGWVIVDGYGFHEGFFSRRRLIGERAIPTRLSSYARRVFDQGLGRAIWFSSGAVVERVAATIAPFQLARQADLWSGVGLACAYAGGADRAAIETLRTIAGPYRSQLARGAATAARGRQQAGNQTPHTELACEIFCGLSSSKAALITDITRENLPTNGVEPAYEIWRQRTQAQFATQEEKETIRSSSYS
jgi:enediyne biosynthesis protein E3